MKIDHLIIGASHVPSSKAFYIDFLGFRETTDDPGAQGGVVLHHTNCELLLIPFPKERLPNPTHFAFQVDSSAEFEALFSKAQKLNLEPRSSAQRSAAGGWGELRRGGNTYRVFYVFDPSGSNVEVMVVA